MNHESEIFEMQAQLCRSLNHAVRLQIIHTLKEGPKPVKEIATAVNSSQSSVSRHLSILRSSGLLSTQRKGAEIYYEITNPKLVAVCEMMRAILSERESQQLDLLKLMKGQIEDHPA